jgi:hypothetical protein
LALDCLAQSDAPIRSDAVLRKHKEDPMTQRAGPFDRLFSHVLGRVSEAPAGSLDQAALDELKKIDRDDINRRSEVRKELEDGARPKRKKLRL